MSKKKSPVDGKFRTVAEGIPEGASHAAGPLLNDPETMKLLHELQVHKIELELQNEELKVQRDRAEDAIKKLEQTKDALEQSRKKLNITLKNAKIGTWEWDIISGIISFDKRTEEIFGIEPGSFKGTLSAFENLVHEDDLTYVKQSLSKALSEKPEQILYRTRPVNGKFSYVSVSSVMIRDRQGNPKTMSGVCFDITDMKTGTELILRNLNEALLRSNKDLQQFAYVASHDLQEPLRMVASFTQLLQMRYSDKLDKDANEFIQFAVDGAKRMYDLLNGLLSFSRIQTTGNEFGITVMNRVVDKVKGNLMLLIERTGAVIESENLPSIKADENQMIQLMQNLISNSIKFSRGKPRIIISSAKNKTEVIFSVTDHGIGIESQYFERIFRIFQKLNPDSDYEGTGVGLAICRRIIERHGGRIWIESVPGSGSTFFFAIPDILGSKN